MKSRRFIIVFWVLLLVPALIIGAVAFRLLVHEQERINRSAITALTGRARIIAQGIHSTVKEVEDNLSEALIGIDEDRLQSTLLEWEETNPLVRNVFIWNRHDLLEYPVKGMASTLEERQFMSRFDLFFSGEKAFKADSDQAVEEQEMNFKSSKDSLFDLARGRTMPLTSNRQEKNTAIQGSKPDISGFTPKRGWIAWFARDQLFVLGWVKKKAGGPVYGIELELATLLSRLIVDLPPMEKKGVSFAILDSRQRIIHLSGNAEVNNTRTGDILLPLSRLLPHWQISVYMDKKASARGKGFLYVSLLLLFIFMAAMISGGLFLTIQARRHMKDAMEKTSFVSSVSHELKTPLTSIRMYAELLLDGRVRAPGKTKHYLTIMVAQSQRLTRLINNVLDFGRLEQGRKVYNIGKIDLQQTLSMIIDAHTIRIKEAGFKIVNGIKEARTAKSHLITLSDPDALEQVVVNLMDNALKYAKEGKFISFTFEHGLNSVMDCIFVKICDHGPGIPEAHKEAIFEKFYRIDNSLTSTFPGSGLGLSIARQIMRDLGGDLFFEPGPEKGSCFIMRIPKR